MTTEAALQQVLLARERRYLVRRHHESTSPHQTFVEVGLNVPGMPKSGSPWDDLFAVAVRRLSVALGPPALSCCDDAGHWALFVTELPAKQAKQLGVSLESDRPWGRLLDLDCRSAQGPITRAALGLRPRECYLCQREAQACILAQRHPLEALRARALELAATLAEGGAHA